MIEERIYISPKWVRGMVVKNAHSANLQILTGEGANLGSFAQVNSFKLNRYYRPIGSGRRFVFTERMIDNA